MSWQQSLAILADLGFDRLQYVSSLRGVEWDAEFVARDLMQNFFDGPVRTKLSPTAK